MRLKTQCSTAVIAACIATFTAPGLTLAQQSAGPQAPSPDETDASAAPEIIVTANRAPTPAAQIGQSFTVLTAVQLRQDQETNVGDVLARTPGVSFSRNGGPGETTSLFIRGADSDQTVVLIDGVKVNDPTDPGTGYDFANLITGDISRIEVLRGSQSTLYGSEAIGGVVNIITAEATKPLQGDVQAEGGSYGTAYVRGAVAGKEDKADWRLGAYYNSTSGVSAFDHAFGGREADGFQTAGLSGRFKYDLTPDLQFDERVYYTWSRAAFDGYDTPTFTFGDDAEYGRTGQLVDYSGLNLALFGGRLKNRLAYEFSGVDHDFEDPNQFGTSITFEAKGRTNTVEYEGTYAVAPGYRAVFGAQSEQSSLFAWSPAFEPAPNRAHDTINSGYGQVTGEVLTGLTLTGGVRYDDQTRVGGHVTGQASAAWSLNGGDTILRASFGQGFKAPSLYQLYSEFGNLALKPEQSNGWDLGVEQRFLDGRLVAQATYFGRTARNLIDFVSCFGVTTGACATNTSGGFYDNVARTEAEGVELQAGWRASERLNLSVNYTLDQVRDRASGLQLARRPEHTANLSASYLWPIKLRTDLAVRYAGDSFNDLAHAIRLKSYTLVDLRLSYPLRGDLELYGRIENLTDQHYETVYQYGTLGRAAYAGVRLSF